ncbi:MAG TPA: 3-isopropylmalate dehydratase large subunit [Firmicutes bacterium]|nr:3-isopropylmalate dehydratase large subunit [Bacillota bacterium]
MRNNEVAPELNPAALGLTMAEKILGAKAGTRLRAGEVGICRVDAVMVHDSNAPTVLDAWERLGCRLGLDPARIVFVADHYAPPPHALGANAHRRMREFAHRYGVVFSEVGGGICHQVMLESGLVKPGSLVVGSDSHSCTYGAFNAFGTGLGASEIAVVMAFGLTWFRVPASIRVILTSAGGGFSPAVGGKDLALYLLGALGTRGALYRALEFGGPALPLIAWEERVTVANMGVEAGAKASIWEADSRVSGSGESQVRPDPGASYEHEITVDLDRLVPYVALDDRVDVIRPVGEVVGTPVQQVLIGSCTNGRASDFRTAATILRGRRVHSGTRLFLCPASRQVMAEITADGTAHDLICAGGSFLTPGCGPCAGYHAGIPADGEVVLSTTNRNFKGRMGNPLAKVILASPATAAASALAGHVADPREYLPDSRPEMRERGGRV